MERKPEADFRNEGKIPDTRGKQYGMAKQPCCSVACWTQVQKGLGSNRSRDAVE